MPYISLVVCLYKERDLLERLLEKTSDCYDDLVVVHDGPEDGSVQTPAHPLAIDFSLLNRNDPLPDVYRELVPDARPGRIHDLVLRHKGRFFEGPRAFQQEPHWPFAWRMAKHDWILRLDADEFPSDQLREWLQGFQKAPEPNQSISGYTCIWPLWDGMKAVTSRWPDNRLFLFHRQRVRFCGMSELGPMSELDFEKLGLVLHHEPRRKSYGIRNILFRKQAYHWRRVIARGLLGSPLMLSRWRWPSNSWPHNWELLRQRPLLTGLKRLILEPMRQIRDLLRKRERLCLPAVIGTGLHHFLLALTFFFCRLTHRRRLSEYE
jgi:hypothetical protein